MQLDVADKMISRWFNKTIDSLSFTHFLSRAIEKSQTVVIFTRGVNTALVKDLKSKPFQPRKALVRNILLHNARIK